MLLLDKLNDKAFQIYTLSTDTGQKITFTLKYMPAVQQWVYSIVFGTKIINGKRLVCSPNVLRAHKDILPFGLAVTSIDILEPQYIDDFTSGRISVYLLQTADLAAIEASYYA